jgi:protein-L-isoaspartate(D-aspartate) O-methyltransferase
LIDSYRHKGLRKTLINTLRDKGIGEVVLKAMSGIPRHLYFDNAFVEFAYQDKAFPIGSGQTISQPYTVAFQTELLNLNKGEKILEIGTGSGYQTAVLCELGYKVYSIERQKKLFIRSKETLPKLGYRPKLFYGDGFKGLPAFGPFDKILITAGAPSLPIDLLDQLKPNGIMVIPIDKKDSQIMYKITKDATGEGYSEEQHGTFQFVPMLKDKATD